MSRKKGKSIRSKVIIAVVAILVATASLTFIVGKELLTETQTKKEEATDQSANEEKSENSSTPTVEEVEEIQETVGENNKNVGAFVSDTHDFYNDTTGYGKIDNLDWNSQTNMAEKIVATLEQMIPQVKNENLKSDLESTRQLASTLLEDQSTSHVRSLHRYFHDLDIALNEYDGATKVWGVTKSLNPQ
ncbi:hypothetical protein [Aquibacillus rhizosphaerae]|uniref:Uncharacterized protein n=1 Tax=Aquibacillus rhizosphaerae TaxID=3051431 RepID=A0ABT7LEK0_9BACI|nr:hypothetical protein [Aquibacillus sp. LR5S19]MDL4843025.1 hypothetical protein [Aquibacillus sp. LR5S19]